MTIEEKFKDDLENNGLFPEEAAAVLVSYVNGPLGEAMKDRMNEPADGYPEPVLTVAWLGVKRAAVEWIDANHPQHWARAVFTR